MSRNPWKDGFPTWLCLIYTDKRNRFHVNSDNVWENYMYVFWSIGDCEGRPVDFSIALKGKYITLIVYS